ncbi:heparan-alpha-glucosaminide N-acetyltransferase domain-containing protein [Mesoterricola silvestris]|uniref:Heparan-alpha-glucosaminide N-acetyltransferase catalytic domain-containing protein n=1 Tax=Mesoterricola silvestris TaxID=2927979 RepID=A0AA48GIV6_9BACT|nr:heparan-alpha-glucosaminide N-acetyltransferase domain-containing protein [Mesoterricola silvestris]BDU72102.1 hypothetical protein METEAL_12760 [Mesoterricola silvestris]
MSPQALSDTTPSRRCDWLDLIRGWAVIVMIEVHCVNVWLHKGLIPDWLNYLNGLVAPSFILAAGYSLALSTFRPDGTIRPFGPTAKRLGFILVCAYLLHAPGLTFAEWTVLATPQKYRELFKIDVLQCIVYSLLILQGLARLIRRPLAYAAVALALALGVTLAAPHLWRAGVADGLWMPIRGLVNGNTDRGVTALFPLFPWFSFAAFGSVLGALYRHYRVLPVEGRARWSEGRWLAVLAAAGVVLAAWGTWQSRTWLWNGPWSTWEMGRLHNTTLPSVAQRVGVICMAGGLLGWFEAVRGRWPGANVVMAASRESLLLYLLHLNLIFGLLLADPIRLRTGWGWYQLGWTGTLALTAALIALNLAAGVAWQKVRLDPARTRRLQRRALLALGIWFVAGGWVTYHHFRRSPELATEPYAFLKAARARKGLPPTPDGLSRDPLEGIREKVRLHGKLTPEEKRLLESKGD